MHGIVSAFLNRSSARSMRRTRRASRYTATLAGGSPHLLCVARTSGCRCGRSLSLMNRLLLFAGAIALSLMQPAQSFAAPPPAPMPVHHAPLPVYHPAPAPAQPNHTTTQGRDSFTLPLELNVRPKPLPQTPGRPALEPTPKLLPYRNSWQPFGWGWSPGFLSSQFPCFANGSSWGPWGLLATPTNTSAMPDVTLGSLVDAQSRNFLTSYPSYGQLSAGTSAATAATSGPTFQYGFQSGQCGPSYSFGL